MTGRRPWSEEDIAKLKSLAGRRCRRAGPKCRGYRSCSVKAEAFATPNRTLLVQLVQQIGLPAIYVFREQAEAGGLMSYSADITSAIRTNARQCAEKLQGGSPAEMPMS